MRLVPYVFEELRFAYVYHVYVRWQTRYRQTSKPLAAIDSTVLGALASPYDIHVLSCDSTVSESRVIVSLRPREAIATAVSKLKGQASKWLRQRSGEPLARGYFACTSGKSAAADVNAYLSSQAEHHGYSQRPLPPVFVRTFPRPPTDETRLASPHAKTWLQFHIVLATSWRRGVFRSESGQEISQRWQSLEDPERFALLKVSFVPDHVHLAVCLRLA